MSDPVTVPITIAARNEQASIEACLDSLLESARYAAGRAGVAFDLLVALDECTDRTAAIAEKRGVRCLASRGGKVEAQRAGLREGPFSIFADADVVVTKEVLLGLVTLMTSNPGLHVAFPQKQPVAPSRGTLLARAIHRYNRANGYSSQRTWFSGKLFAIRRWHIPTPEQIAVRARALRHDAFLRLTEPMRIDDIYLSRAVVAEHGVEAIAESQEGLLLYRAPETWRGMYRYYRRMRWELERMDVLFPELANPHGTRRADRLRSAPLSDRLFYLLFQGGVLSCRIAYALERAYYRHLSARRFEVWPAIEETKAWEERPITIETARPDER